MKMGKPSLPPDPLYMFPWNFAKAMVKTAQGLYSFGNVILNEGVYEDRVMISPGAVSAPVKRKTVGAADAKTLVDALSNHYLMQFDFDREAIEGKIAAAKIPSRGRFYTALEGCSFSEHLSEGYRASVSVDFLLRNDGAEKYRDNHWLHLFERVFFVNAPNLIRGHFADVLAEENSDFPFSLFGTFTAHGLDDGCMAGKNQFIATPNAWLRELMSRIEMAHTTYEPEPSAIELGL